MALPIMVSTWSFGLRAHAAAWPAFAAGGSSLDAVEAACRAVEADPEVDSVGYGGLPDRDGHVSLDGAIMLSPSSCGSVCALRRFMHPVSIARRIMESTPHIMLAAEGAEAFASATGFAPAELLSPSAAAAWRRWKAAPHTVDQSADRGSMSLRPVDRGRGGQLFQHDEEARRGGHDTIGVLAIDGRGIMAGACSTSGTPYKLPGRVGDSPIIGHGLYVDPPAGGATATGTGELIMGVCGSFLAVEQMRRGASPREAAITVLHRIAESLTLRPDHQVAVLTLRPDGAWAGAALHPGFKASISTTEGHRIADPDDVLLASSSRS